MQDHEKPEGTWSGSTGSIPNRKRSATSLGANIQQRDDSHNNISAPKPSQSKSQKSPKSTKFQPSEFPYQATGPKPSKQSSLTPNSQSEEQSILGSEPRSSNSRTSSPDPYSRPEPKDPGTDELFNNPRAEIKTKRKWDPKEWNKDEIDSDDEYMSLAVMMKLPHELSLLQEYLETYRSFNDYLGRKHSPCTLNQPSLHVLYDPLTQTELRARHRIRAPPQRFAMQHLLHRRPPRIVHRAPAHPAGRKATRQSRARQNGTGRRDHL